MKILVDEMPSKPKECLFAQPYRPLFSYEQADRYIPHCALRLMPKSQIEGGWEVGETYCSCMLNEEEGCPFLKAVGDKITD